MMRKQLYKLAHELGIEVVVLDSLPNEDWDGAFNCVDMQVEVNREVLEHEDVTDFVLLHELCHALQFLNNDPLWEQFQEDDSYAGALELDCEMRALGWLHMNGYHAFMDEYVFLANANLGVYGLEIQ